MTDEHNPWDGDYEHCYVDIVAVHTEKTDNDAQAKQRVLDIISGWFDEDPAGPDRYHIGDIDAFSERLDSLAHAAGDDVFIEYDVEFVTQVDRCDAPHTIRD